MLSPVPSHGSSCCAPGTPGLGNTTGVFSKEQQQQEQEDLLVLETRFFCLSSHGSSAQLLSCSPLASLMQHHHTVLSVPQHRGLLSGEGVRAGHPPSAASFPSRGTGAATSAGGRVV